MSLGLESSLRAAMAALIADRINAGSGPGVLSLYTGTRPATGGTAGALFAVCALTGDVIAGTAAGTLDFPTIEDGLVLPSGVSSPTWGRVTDSAGTFCLDFDVSDCSALIAQYATGNLAGLLAHFGASDLAGLLAALTATDRALLGDIVLASLSFVKNDDIRLGALTLTVA